MIAKLTGLVDSLSGDSAVVDVGGVGYLVFCPTRALSQLEVGQVASLLIETHVREDRIHLYGFLDALDREWFRTLMTVQGVGVKVALAVLSVLSPDTLIQAIAAGDRALLTRVSGVGAKLATRILTELRDKVATIALGPAAASGGAGARPAATVDAISALVNLGYGPSASAVAVSQAARRLGPEAGVEALIRGGLQELSPREHRG